VDAQTDLFGSSLWPNALDQGSPADDLVCLLHQDDEEIHGACAERYDLCAICQKPVSDRQFERAEAQQFAALITHGMLSFRARVASWPGLDRKSTRLNSSHTVISYAVFCLKKKKTIWRSAPRIVTTLAVTRPPPSAGKKQS